MRHFTKRPCRLSHTSGERGAGPPDFAANDGFPAASTRAANMFIQILQQTPIWVWSLLAVLIALGLSQTRTRQVSLQRATIVPLVFIAFSLSGVMGSFGRGPATVVAWLAGVAFSAVMLGGVVTVRGADWSPKSRQFTVPGSYIPLMLIVGVFLLRYSVGVMLALHPDWAHDAAFAGECALAYGGFAGLFWSRARSLRRLARVEGMPMEQTM